MNIQISNMKQAIAFTRDEMNNIKTTDQWIDFIFRAWQYQDSLKLSIKTTLLLPLLSKLDNYIIFDNAGGNLFDVILLDNKKDNIDAFLNSDLKSHFYCSKINGVHIIYKFTSYIPDSYYESIIDDLNNNK